MTDVENIRGLLGSMPDCDHKTLICPQAIRLHRLRNAIDAARKV